MEDVILVPQNLIRGQSKQDEVIINCTSLRSREDESENREQLFLLMTSQKGF